MRTNKAAIGEMRANLIDLAQTEVEKENIKNAKGVNIFKAEVVRRANPNYKVDYIAPASKIKMTPDGEHFELQTDEGNITLPMTGTCHSQTAQDTGVGVKYYNKCSAIPGLRSLNVNAWLNEQAKEDKSRMIRTLDGKARANVSSKFLRFDNDDAMKAIAPLFSEFGNLGVELKSYNLTDDYLMMQAVFPGMALDVRPGDTVNQGAMIRNSEVGLASVEVRSLIWRLICSNGAIGETILSRKHVSSRIDTGEENAAIYSKETIEAMIESYRLQLRDVVRDALAEEKFEARVNLLRDATEQTFSKRKAKKVVEKLNKVRGYSFTEDDMDMIFGNMASEDEFSKYGVSNGITAIGHEDDVSPEDAFDFEQKGQDIITIPDKVWNDIIAAA